MGRIRKTAAGKAKPPKVDKKTEAERLRIAEDIARALRQAGYKLSLDDDSLRRLKRNN